MFGIIASMMVLLLCSAWVLVYAGVIYLGFGIGSICGSIIASLFGGFYVTFYVIFALLILSLALSTTIRQPEQKMLREAHGSL